MYTRYVPIKSVYLYIDGYLTGIRICYACNFWPELFTSYF